MNTGETQGYILTFCCVNCGKPEIFAQYPSEDVVPEDQIRARIYQVGCNYCGWRGDACGISAIRVSHATKLKAKVSARGN
jgi:hypothetical protein